MFASLLAPPLLGIPVLPRSILVLPSSTPTRTSSTLSNINVKVLATLSNL